GVGVRRPAQDLPPIVAREQLRSAGQARQAAHPALVADEGGPLAACKVPALDAPVLRAGENEPAGRVKAATDERTRVLQLLDHVRLKRVDHGGFHARISRIALAFGSATGMGWPWTWYFFLGLRPRARK